MNSDGVALTIFSAAVYGPEYLGLEKDIGVTRMIMCGGYVWRICVEHENYGLQFKKLEHPKASRIIALSPMKKDER